MLTLALRLGARNLLRNRRRSVITSLSVAFGVCVAVVFIGTRQSLYDRLIASGARGGFGLFSLSQAGYLTEPTAASFIAPSAKFIASLRTVPGVALVAPRISAMAVVATSKSSTGAALLGIDPSIDTKEFNLMLASLTTGTALQASDTQGCLIGSGMAKLLGVKLGQKVIFTTTDKGGQVVSNIAYVRGTFHTGSLEIDGHMVVLGLPLMRQVLAYKPNTVSFLAFYGAAEQNLQALGGRLKRQLHSSPWELSSWRQSLPDIAQAIDLDGALYHLLFFFAGVIIAIGILNTMMLNIIERRREFGVMLALGLTPESLVTMVLSEALMIGCLGLTLGGLVAAPLYLYLHRVGLDLTIFLGEGQSNGPRGVEDILGCRLTWSEVGIIGLSLLLLNLAAAVYPALKAARTVPIAAIRAP